MSAVSEHIVREYFELLGFLVSEPCKCTASGRHKTSAEEVDLLVINPRVGKVSIPEPMVWTAEDLRGVGQAVVAVRGCHTERFYASDIERAPEILRFAGVESVQYYTRLLGGQAPVKILCVPRLPASGDLRRKIIDVLRERGIDGVISFRTILMELVAKVDINRNYDKSDILQMIRILKSYDMLKSGQMDLFSRSRRKPSRRKERVAADAASDTATEADE